MAKNKSKFRIYLEYIPFLVLYKVIRIIPFGCAIKLSQAVFGLGCLVYRQPYTRSVQHILHSGIVDDRKAAQKMARRSLMEFSKLLVEIIKMSQLYRLDKISVGGDSEAIDYTLSSDHDNHQVILVVAHLGNWEVAGTAFSERARIPMMSMMRQFDNPLIGKLILDHRAGDMHQLSDKRNGIRPILKAIAEKRNVTMLIDQHASGGEGVECAFFGHPAKVHMTPALLHLKTGIPIIPEVTVRTGDDFSFELRVGPLIRYTPTGDKEQDIKVVTQLCISALEKLICTVPDQWLWAPRHWLDINRRDSWKYQAQKSE